MFSLSLNGSEHFSWSFFFHLMVRNEIPSVILFNKMVRNGLLSIFVLVFFPSTIWFGTEFQLFYLQRMALGVFRSAKQTKFQQNESKFTSVPCSEGKKFSRKRATLICGAASLHCLNICPIWTKLCDWTDMSRIIWKIGTSSQECFQRCGNERFSRFSIFMWPAILGPLRKIDFFRFLCLNSQRHYKFKTPTASATIQFTCMVDFLIDWSFLLQGSLFIIVFYSWEWRPPMKWDASTKRPQPVFILSIKSSLIDFIPDKW